MDFPIVNQVLLFCNSFNMYVFTYIDVRIRMCMQWPFSYFSFLEVPSIMTVEVMLNHDIPGIVD